MSCPEGKDVVVEAVPPNSGVYALEMSRCVLKAESARPYMVRSDVRSSRMREIEWPPAETLC
jgi:hypothetical protein